MYIHQLRNWPKFNWDVKEVATLLAEVRFKQGKLLGKMDQLGFDLKSEATLQTLTQDVVKSSEIEGEVLDVNEVRSSIARRLGLDVIGLIPSDRHVDGMVDMMLDATQYYSQPLHEERLFNWHTDNTSWYLVADFDKQNWKNEAVTFLTACKGKSIPAYLERSRSGNGRHVWIFFNRPYPAVKSRKVFISILEQCGLISIFDKGSSDRRQIKELVHFSFNAALRPRL